MGSDPMVKKSHYAPRPLQQPQMPDMKQIKRSVCNHIRHFSLLSFPPRQFRRARAILSVAKFRQDIFDNVAITHQLKAVFRIR